MSAPTLPPRSPAYQEFLDEVDPLTDLANRNPMFDWDIAWDEDPLPLPAPPKEEEPDEEGHGDGDL